MMPNIASSSAHHSHLLAPLRLFNSHSRDPCTHFKLVPLPGGSSELRLCSDHPHFVRCTIQGDATAVHVWGDGPDRLRVSYELHREQDMGAVLGSLLALLQERRGEGQELLDWECEDWVGAGNPCRLREACGDAAMEKGGLGFGTDDLWCVEAYPSVEARLSVEGGGGGRMCKQSGFSIFD